MLYKIEWNHALKQLTIDGCVSKANLDYGSSAMLSTYKRETTADNLL